MFLVRVRDVAAAMQLNIGEWSSALKESSYVCFHALKDLVRYNSTDMTVILPANSASSICKIHVVMLVEYKS